jgi:hypothetical protein
MGNTQCLVVENSTNKPVRLVITDPKPNDLAKQNPELDTIIPANQALYHDSWRIINFIFTEKFQLVISRTDVMGNSISRDIDSSLITYTDCNYKITETTAGLSIQKVPKAKKVTKKP